MSGSLAEAVGFAAGILTTVAFIPQVIKTWRSRSADDLSLAMLVAFAAGVMLWLVYGFARASWPTVLSNAVTFALVTALLFVKLRSFPEAN